MTDKDIEIVDLRGRINSLEILGKRYETRIRELEAALRDAQNRLLQVTEPWRGARADITPAAVAAIVPLLNEWQCLLRSAPLRVTQRLTGERNMVDDKELAAIIAREIFKVGADSPALPATRIQYMHQPGPDAPERPMGGFAEKPLANFIERVLAKHRSY